MRSHWKLLALGVAFVVALVVIVVSAVSRTGTENEPAPEAERVDGVYSSQPSVSWALDIRALSENDTDVLLSMPSTLSGYYGYGSVSSAGSAVVAAIGTPDAADPTRVSYVTLVGVDPETGDPLWRTRIGEVDQCGYSVGDSPLACWSEQRVMFVDVHDGTLLGDVGTDFDIANATVEGDTVYVGGARQEPGAPDEVQTPVFTRGTVTDIDASYRREYPDRGPYAAAYVSPNIDAGVVNTPNDAENNGRYLAVDPETGDVRFDYTGESLQAIGDGLFLTTDGGRSGDVGTQNLLDSTGAEIRSIPVPGYPAIAFPGDSDDVPLFIGDGAYDRATGAELWRSSALQIGEFSGRDSAVAAVVGQSVIVTNPDTKTVTALDIDSGAERWQTPWEDAYWIRDGVTDGTNFVFSDYSGMHAIRGTDGAVLWSVPLPEGADPRELRVTETAGHLSMAWQNQFLMWE